ncbi:MAG TPA: hypothetical protein ENJ30_07350 [Desulfobulbaceae bacterium]|nr:hypothetical protein [Desulfobulbaceae bacterium]
MSEEQKQPTQSQEEALAAQQAQADEAAKKAAEAAAKKAEENKQAAKAVAEAKPEKKGAKHTGKKIRVRPVNPYKMFCPTQEIEIYPSTITEVVDDKWIRAQLNEGTLEKA